jgi:hypothetical protein
MTNNFFFIKIEFYLFPGPPKKDIQATGENFNPKKITSSSSRKEIYNFFPIFVGSFCPPGSGIYNTDFAVKNKPVFVLDRSGRINLKRATCCKE